MSKLRRNSILLIVAMVLAASNVARAQQDGINAYSPYTLFGIGSMDMMGTSAEKGMAGAGIANKTPETMNTLNPAAWSVAPQQTFTFSFGLNGSNDYLKTSTSTTSSNKFNLGDIGFQFPIAKKLGFGMSLSSYSSVGYQLSLEETDTDITTTIGPVTYDYEGAGGTTLLKAGMGWEPVKGLSIGAAVLFYHSAIERGSTISIESLFQPTYEFRSISYTTYYQYTRANYEVGAIYSAKIGENKSLSFAAVFQPKVTINQDISTQIYTIGSATADSVSVTEASEQIVLPNKITGGIAYKTPKLTIALDYVQQDFTGAYALDNGGVDVTLTKYQDYRLGVSYTPNRYDIRKAMNRWTYRAGLRYGDSYLAAYGSTINDYSLTFGAGIPLQKNGPTQLNAAFDLGRRGTIEDTGIQETYFKFSLGVNFLVLNEWFIRHKFK